MLAHIHTHTHTHTHTHILSQLGSVHFFISSEKNRLHRVYRLTFFFRETNERPKTMFNCEVKKTNLSLALQWYVLTERQILAQNLGIPKKQFTYQMMPKKKEGEAPDLRKAQCSSLGDY